MGPFRREYAFATSATCANASILNIYFSEQPWTTCVTRSKRAAALAGKSSI